ncbi:MAG TPA: arsenate reductase ArsC [Candidatus Acidoferrales bacterium]|nr:arsenate reductase ArsC [Candidatus Acidoferrales bacterium]
MAERIPRVLILCTENSARSQMGEAILRHLAQGSVEVVSAGTCATSVDPLAIEALQEMEVDVAGLRSKSVEEFRGQEFDAVITVCDQARDACPAFAGRAVRVHYDIPDPAAAGGTPEERMEAFRRARDLLFSCLCEFFTVLVGPD